MTNYTQLQLDVENWLADNIPQFILLAENEINRALRLCQQETEITLSAALTDESGFPYFQLPDDYLEQRYLRVKNYASNNQEFVPPSDYYRFRLNSMDAPYYTIANCRVIVPQRFSDDDFIFGYYAKFPHLSLSNQTNWLSNNAYDVLLKGALVQGSEFNRDFSAAEKWAEKYAIGLQALNNTALDGRYGYPLVMRDI
jgi:hypothetical protein